VPLAVCISALGTARGGGIRADGTCRDLKQLTRTPSTVEASPTSKLKPTILDAIAVPSPR
jgi:hypothetical protein